MAEDIICTVPEACGDKDCKYHFHLAHYWAYDDGTFSVCDTDGNHESCEESDVPNAEQECRLWLEYYEYVASTGHDPCNEFRLPVDRKKPHQWQARVRNWIGASAHGLKVTGVRRRGRGPWIDPHEATKEVQEYLFLGGNAALATLGTDLKTMDEFLGTTANPNLGMTNRQVNPIEVWHTFSVDESPAPWSAERTAAWLKRKAREAVREKRKRCPN